MALLPLSRAEEEALADLESKTEELQEAQRQSRRALGYGADADEDPEYKKLEDTVKALSESEPVLSAMVKKALNEQAEKLIPGGSLSPFITIAENLEESLDRPDGVRVQNLLRKLAVRAFNSLGDAEINKARAEALHTRYTSLTDAGFDDDLAAKIIVAECGRPLNWNLPDRKSS